MNRVLVTFWTLVAVAILAVGGLSNALSSPPSAATGIAFLAMAIIAVVAASFAARILLVVSRNR